MVKKKKKLTNKILLDFIEQEEEKVYLDTKIIVIIGNITSLTLFSHTLTF